MMKYDEMKSSSKGSIKHNNYCLVMKVIAKDADVLFKVMAISIPSNTL